MLIYLTERNTVLKKYTEALNSVRGDICVINYLQTEQFNKYLSAKKSIAILAIGKAAQSMAQGAYQVLNNKITNGLVVTKEGHLSTSSLIDGFEYLESSHPIPSELSLIAGQKVIDFITDLPEETHLLVLISGGTSALVEKLKPSVCLDDLIRVNDWLIASGLSIEQINSIRQKLSTIKGGQLSSFTKHLKVSNLLLSDVISNDPAFIGSGLLVPATVKIHNINLPDWLQALLDKCEMPETDIFETNIFTDLVATNALLLNSIYKQCQLEKNNKIFKNEIALSLSVELEADKIITELLKGENGYYIWGGEPTVDLTVYKSDVGEGGRNQHLALLIANKIKGIKNIVVLCIGTDGSDGTTDDAGALIDSGTVLRGEIEGLDVEEHIRSFNSAEFLRASGDVINTGPTGTNVMDVVLAYKWE